jgi:hypothetical protein
VNVRSMSNEDNASTIDLPVASTPTNRGVGRGKLEWHAVHLGERFRLTTPQDHKVSLCEIESAGIGSVGPCVAATTELGRFSVIRRGGRAPLAQSRRQLSDDGAAVYPDVLTRH